MENESLICPDNSGEDPAYAQALKLQEECNSLLVKAGIQPLSKAQLDGLEEFTLPQRMYLRGQFIGGGVA